MPSDTPRPDFDRPQATKIVCRVFEGFANRLNGIASALSTGRPVSIQWAINDHCPASFEDCFRPLDGVEVANESALAYPHSVSPQKLCWFYPKNVDELPYGRFRSRMMASYDYLLSRIAVTDWACPAAPALGCHYRHYLAKPDSFSRYCGWIRCAVSQLSPATVHVASDSADHKSQLLALLADLQVPTTHNDAPLLDHDLDRSRANVLGVCRDILSLAECRLGIITNTCRSTVSDPAQARGALAYATSLEDSPHRSELRDDLFEPRPVEHLLQFHPQT